MSQVVDLWGTCVGDSRFDGDSLSIVFSSTKTLTAIAVATLVDHGLISYEDKVAKVWPEFAKNGKENVTVQEVMRHEAGLARIK